MILHCTPSNFAASTRAGTLTSLIDARCGIETFRAVGAFRSAVWWTTNVVLQAGTSRIRAYNSALRVRAARIRQARISFPFRQRRRSANPGAMHEGIAGVAAGAAADGIVVHREAVRVLSARTWTRVRAFVIDARLVL